MLITGQLFMVFFPQYAQHTIHYCLCGIVFSSPFCNFDIYTRSRIAFVITCKIRTRTSIFCFTKGLKIMAPNLVLETRHLGNHPMQHPEKVKEDTSCFTVQLWSPSPPSDLANDSASAAFVFVSTSTFPVFLRSTIEKLVIALYQIEE